MSSSSIGPEGRNAQHAQIETLIARYPNLDDTELKYLVQWFRKDASALDVALIASNESIRDNYSRFRSAHVDCLTARDLALAMMFVSVVIGLIAVIIYLAP